MSLKYVAAYLMAGLSHEQPTAAEVKIILSSVGAETDDTILNKLISEMKDKTIHEVIAAGMTKLQSVPTGGAVAVSGSGGATHAVGGAEPAAEEKKEEEEEEEEDDLGFSLFD